MKLENMREEFPEMPESMRAMIEREVASQVRKEERQQDHILNDRKIQDFTAQRESEHGEDDAGGFEQGGSEQRSLTQRKPARKKAGRTFLLVAAVAALMCTTVFAGVTIRERFFTETEGNYGVNITIGPAETEAESGDAESSAATLLSEMEAPEEIPAEVTVEASYIPEGMVQYDDGWKIDYEDDLYGGSYSMGVQIMDEDPTETLITETSVVDSEVLEINGHYAVWLSLNYKDDGSGSTVQKMYVLYPEVWRMLTIYSLNEEVTKEELLRVAEGISLVGSEEMMSLEEAYTISDYEEETELEDYDAEDGGSMTVEASAVEGNLHQIGDSFEISACSDSEADEEFLHTVSVRVSDVQVSDNMSTLGDDWQSILDSVNYADDLKKYSDEDGSLLPELIEYVKTGDGIDSLNTVVKTEEAEQKLICATIEFTNTGDADLHNILYNADLMTLTEDDDGMVTIYDRSSLEEGDWDYMTASCGYWMDYFTAGGEGQNGSNYITDLKAGETAVATVAWLVRADEMPYLYLNMEGGTWPIYAEDLATGYVDFRSLEN
ncbi:MAG: DUF4367 domain-containing protein [Lachnospiraceae bacterium]|nr:DUF4367 domain-containing protein [Lachnospiraceae bacterium]